MKNILIVLAVLILLGAVYHFGTTNQEKNKSITYRDDVITFTGDTLFTAQYSEDGEHARISLSGVQHELSRTPSASGGKYQNDDGSVVFWEKAGEARLEINGEVVMGTTVSSELSPLQTNGWYWKETQYSNDEIISAVEPTKFLVTFMEDGRFSATTDCNNGAGSYEAETSNLTFGPIAATKKACLGETQETEFFNMLSEVQSYLITENGDLALQLKFDSGVMLFTPAR